MVARVVLRVRAWASSVHDGQLRAASAVLPHTGRARARYTSGHGARARMAARLGVEGRDALDVVGAIPNPNPDPNPNPSPNPNPNPNLNSDPNPYLTLTLALTLTLSLALALALTLALALALALP